MPESTIIPIVDPFLNDQNLVVSHANSLKHKKKIRQMYADAISGQSSGVNVDELKAVSSVCPDCKLV